MIFTSIDACADSEQCADFEGVQALPLVVLNDESASDASPVGVVQLRQTGASLGYLVTQCAATGHRGDMNASHDFFHAIAGAYVQRGSHV